MFRRPRRPGPTPTPAQAICRATGFKKLYLRKNRCLKLYVYIDAYCTAGPFKTLGGDRMCVMLKV